MIKHPTKPLAVHTWDWKEQPDWPGITDMLDYIRQTYHIDPTITDIETGSDEHAIVIAPKDYDPEAIQRAYSQHYEWENGVDQDALNWDRAADHLNTMRKAYTDIGMAGILCLNNVINPLLISYEKGERTKKLYDEIMELQ